MPSHFKLFTLILLPLLTLIFYQNCSPMEAISKHTMSSSSSLLQAAFEYRDDETLRTHLNMANEVTCEDLTNVINQNIDATPILKKCIERHQGSTLLIPSGRYTLKTRLQIKGPITIKTKGKITPCHIDDPDCARFVSANETDLSEPIPQQFGVVHLEGERVAVQNIIFDGDRHNRYDKQGFAACQSGNGIAGTLVSAHLKSGLFEGSVLRSTICGTGMVVWIGTENMLITDNIIYSNGEITRNRGWADGITIHDGKNIRIRRNAFIDNSDVQLVFGGCQNCFVTDNTFTHSRDPKQAAFAELVLHSWQDGTSGNFQGTVVAQNEIDCGPNFLCGHGLALGADAWYTGNRTFGATVVENSISRAQLAIQVDEITGPTTIKDNLIGVALRGELTCHNEGVESRPMAAINVSPASKAYLSHDSLRDLEQSQNYLQEHDLYTEINHDYCVPYPNNSRVESQIDVSSLLSGTQPSDEDGNSNNGDSSQEDDVPEEEVISIEHELQTKNPNIASFIIDLYRRILTRSWLIDAKGFNYFYRAFENDFTIEGCQTLIRDFYKSDEFKKRRLTDRQYITSLYHSTLGYSPDSKGLIFHSNHLKNGDMTREQKLEDFISHPDTRARCQNVVATDSEAPKPDSDGNMSNEAGGDENLNSSMDNQITMFIQSLYTHVLKRTSPASEDEVRYFYEAFAKNRTVSGCRTLIRDFYRSKEFADRFMPHSEFVTDLYHATLGFAPDSEGLDFHVGHLTSRQMTRDQKREEFINHSGTRTRCQSIL